VARTSAERHDRAFTQQFHEGDVALRADSLRQLRDAERPSLGEELEHPLVGRAGVEPARRKPVVYSHV
jgi:hypothetical protein